MVIRIETNDIRNLYLGYRIINSMSNIWFTSDWHFGHKRVITFENDYRAKALGVSTIEEHDEYITDTILTNVGKRDILYVLGDNGDVDQTFDVFAKCEAQQIRYVPGNHDKETAIERLATIPKVSVFPPATYKQHWVTHHPIHPVELYGRKNIHGHVHSKSVQDENYINVSVEAVGKPVIVSWNDIKTGVYTTHEPE
jgi:calcineurin-like phosphoesterase family protein